VGYAPGEEQRAQRSQQPPVTVSVSAKLAPPAEAKPTPPAEPNNSAVILDLAEWRARRRGTEQPSQRRAGNSATDDSDRADGQDSHP
jgi:hypothetical protein